MTQVPQKITEVYAWICTEPDGGDGVPAAELPGMPGIAMPLISSDRRLIEALRPYALKVRREQGYPVRLMRFSTAEELERL